MSSPQIVWNYSWMDKFLTLIRTHGSDVDFMAIHDYGPWNDVARAQRYTKQAYTKYRKPVWVTEIGATASSAGSNGQVRRFMSRLLTWIDGQPYVARVAWTGCFAYTAPPDNYLSAYGGMFDATGALRQIGNLYVCGVVDGC